MLADELEGLRAHVGIICGCGPSHLDDPADVVRGSSLFALKGGLLIDRFEIGLEFAPSSENFAGPMAAGPLRSKLVRQRSDRRHARPEEQQHCAERSERHSATSRCRDLHHGDDRARKRDRDAEHRHEHEADAAEL